MNLFHRSILSPTNPYFACAGGHPRGMGDLGNPYSAVGFLLFDGPALGSVGNLNGPCGAEAARFRWAFLPSFHHI
jgi:hypothetical protein